jgi:hypothetical protein
MDRAPFEAALRRDGFEIVSVSMKPDAVTGDDSRNAVLRSSKGASIRRRVSSWALNLQEVLSISLGANDR